MTGPSIAVNIPLSGRGLAWVCLVLALLGLAAGIALAWPPAWDPKAGLAGLLPLLPAAAGLFGVLAGGICLLAAGPAAALTASEPSGEIAPALRTIFLDFNRLLMEERDRLDAVQQAFASSTQEAMAATGRLSRLATAAGEAESRLMAGIAQAEEALRQPMAVVGWAADAAQRVEQALPALADMIRDCGQQQSQATVATLEAVVVRMANEAHGPLQTIHNAATETVGQIAALGQTAASLAQDVAGLDTASRGIATASAMVVARVSEAVVHFESVLATLPSAAAGVTQAAEQATQAVTEAAVTLTADAAALDQSNQAAMRIVQDLRAAGDDMAVRFGDAARTLTDTAQVTTRHAADAAGKIDAALDRLPAALTQAANQAARTLSEAAAVLCADSAALDASGRETLQAAEMLLTAGRETASELVAAGQQMRDAGSLIAAHSAAAADHLARVPGAADQAAQTLVQAAAALHAEGAGIGATLNEAASGTMRAVETLRAAGDGAAAIGAALDRLPGLTAGIEAAASGATRALTVGAAAVARTVETAANRLNEAVTDHDRIRQQMGEMAEHLDTAGRSIGAAFQSQIARLSDITGQAEAHTSRLPAATDQVAMAAERLTQMADAARAALPSETDRTQSVALLGSLSADLHDALRRFEAVLTRQDGVFPAVFDAMAKVETAVADVRAALDRPADDSADLVVSGSAAPAALAATLDHLEGVASRTGVLLRQTEALAEAVMHGRAPGLPLLLADRTPALLAEVDTTIRRLRSVATALALASDGPPRAAGATG